VWLHVFLTLVLFDTTVNAQNDTAERFNGEPAIEENRAEPSRTTTKTDDAAMSEAAMLDHTEANRTDLTLSEFLFAIRVGPFFSFGLWAGLLGEIEFEFKLHDRGFLSLLTSVNGGYQIDKERGDYLFSEAIGYRLYFPNSSGGAWTFFGGVSFGYFTTTYDHLEERGLDWLHIGLKAKGGYYFLTDESLSVGIDIGFSLSYQFDEYVGSSDFLVAIPNLSVTFLF